ncbi:hypothetical protein MOQ_005923 [Trypanosoma cruzi marinkellei]|uniref:Uncharacterized protein n=1 Tax=Trypanosoma cruzi marinkellei TaxID=85056 RepID=K2MT75_TRYCR|nr:hypothetical protein MOQ_005923 [Trypanosoma cruzi marinkellei]
MQQKKLAITSMKDGEAAVNSAFREACQYGDLPAVQDYVSRGCDVESASSDGCTGLWLAAEAGHTGVVAFLCSIGANTNVVRSPGRATALFLASQNGHIAVARLLLQFGADPNARRETGATPIFIAAQQGHLEIVQLLIDSGGTPTTPNHQGVSPIMVAAHQGHIDCVQLLLEKGCDPYEVAMGRNTIEWAEASGHGKEIAQAVMQGAVTQLSVEKQEEIVSHSATGGTGSDADGRREQVDETPFRPGLIRLETGGTEGRQQDVSVVSFSMINSVSSYEPQYLLRGSHTARPLSTVPQGTTREAGKSGQGRSKASDLSSHDGFTFRTSASRQKVLMKRENEENASFVAMQRSMFQKHHARRVVEEPRPIDVQETQARWDIWKRTLYEQIRQLERSGKTSSGDLL